MTLELLKSINRLGIGGKSFSTLLISTALILCLNCEDGQNKKKDINELQLEKNEFPMIVDSINSLNTFDLVFFKQDINNIKKFIVVGSYDKAVELLLKYENLMLKKDVDVSDEQLRTIYSDFGQCYLASKKNEKAMEYYDKAYDIAVSLNNIGYQLFNLNDLIALYLELNQLDKGLEYLKKAFLLIENNIDISNMSEDLILSVYSIYTKISNYYVDTKQYSHGKPYLIKAKEILEKYGDVFTKREEIVLLSCEADYLIAENKFVDAINVYKKGLKIAEEINHLEYQNWLLNAIKKVYVSMGNYEKAYSYQTEEHRVDSTLFNRESEDRISELQTIYETDRLKSENKEKEAELEIKKAQLGEQKQKNRVAWLATTAALISTLGAGMFIETLRKKNKIIKAERDEKEEKNVQLAQAMEEINTINEHLTETNEELEQANAKKEQANAKLELTNTELEQTNTKLEKANFDINAGITYASKIQESILKNDVSEFFPKSFVFYKSKDTTGGDFYHSSEGLNGKKVLILADCTGHGVPGSFLTIFGKTNIQQISDKVENPNDIIDYMDKQFLNLHKKSANSVVGDAMDIACIFYDPETKIMEFSSALMNIFIFRKDGEIENIRSTDRAAVGSKPKSSTFQGYTKEEIQLYPGDEVILYTDGMSDQFDKDGKKLGIAGFKQMLPHLSTIPLTERASYLQKYYEGLMKKENGEIVPQTDDMTMVGFKVE